MIEIRKNKTIFFVGIDEEGNDVGEEVPCKNKTECWEKIISQMIVYCSQGLEVLDTTKNKRYWITATGKRLSIQFSELEKLKMKKGKKIAVHPEHFSDN